MNVTLSVDGLANSLPFSSTYLIVRVTSFVPVVSGFGLSGTFSYVIGVSLPGVVGTGGTLYPFSGWFGSTGTNGFPSGVFGV